MSGEFSRREILAGAIGAGAAVTQAQETTKRLAVRGTYSSPASFWKTGARLDQYGINAVFVHSGSITEELMKRAGDEGAKVYAEFATLNGKGYVETHPEAWPINEKGEKSPAASWFLGACPTDPGFHEYRMRQLRDFLQRFPVAGVWMDYFHWHAQFEEPTPILPETCFCHSCLRSFSQNAGVRPPEGSTSEKAAWILRHHERAWRDWRVHVLHGWARGFRGLVWGMRPGALLGVYHCPWTDEEYGGARRRILGLDFHAIAPYVDVFSPMVYHGRMGRDTAWVRRYIQWISQELPTEKAIWPIVQAHGDPQKIAAPEFEQAMRAGTSGRATGIQMFTIGAVAQDPGKMQVLQRLYREWGAGG